MRVGEGRLKVQVSQSIGIVLASVNENLKRSRPHFNVIKKLNLHAFISPNLVYIYLTTTSLKLILHSKKLYRQLLYKKLIESKIL